MNIRIDTDGVVYWPQLANTHIQYGFNWRDRLVAMGHSASGITAQMSTNSIDVAATSTIYSSGVHAFHVAPSGNTIGQEPVFTSKVFLSDGQIDKAKIRVKVTS